MAAYYDLIPASIGGNGEPVRVWGQGVTTSFFDVLQLRMVLGRGFAANEDAAAVIVLNQDLWRRRFKADPTIVGKPILLSGRSFTVVGIAPASFHSIDQILDTEFWVPLGETAQLVPNLPMRSSREFHWLSVLGRLRAGISQKEADAELAAFADRYARQYPATDKDNAFYTQLAGTLPPFFERAVTLFLTALSIIVLLVLAIAGANVANLLLVQAAARQREMAVRLAVGATAGRLRRQMLTESVLLGLAGGLAGLVLSAWAVRGLSQVRLPSPVPLAVSVDLDWRTLLYAFLLSLVGGWLLGLAPAWAASRPRLANALKGADILATPGRRVTLRNALVVGQIAMAVVLVCVTGLFLRSLESASTIKLGFRPQGVISMSFDPSLHGYDPERTVRFVEQLQQRATETPGVTAAVVTDVSPLSGGHRSEGFGRVGHAANASQVPTADLYMAGPRYFEVLGVPLIAGHDFGGESENGPKTAIINQVFAKRLFGNENPIGQHITGNHQTYEIIGVAGNVKSRSIGEDQRPVLYRSLRQSVASDPSMMGYTLLVRTASNSASIAAEVKRQIHALDPTMAVFNEESMEEHVRTAYFLPRLAATLFGIFGCIGLVLATVGLFGVVSYSVSRRTREIGIRIALGAKTAAVERMVLRQGLLLSLIAVALGWPAAWMLAKLATSFLYGIEPHDALTFAAVPPFLVVIALAACWIPARRAASVDPMQALRTE
jgi:predicted permease